MASDRSRYGLLVSALGAVLLAVSVFLPWYASASPPPARPSRSHAGQSARGPVRQRLPAAAAGNLHGTLASTQRARTGAVSAHQVLHDLNVVLLVLAGLALLDALLPLARGGSGDRARGGRGSRCCSAPSRRPACSTG